MYIARSSAKSDPSTPFSSSPNIPLIAIRKRVTLITPPCDTSKSVCLFCEMGPHTLTLIHLSPISSLMNSVILCFIVVQVSFLCWLCHALSPYQRRLLLFSIFSWIHLIFFCYFWYCDYCASLFRKASLSFIYLLLHLQVPDKFLACHLFEYFAEYIY